MDRKDILLKAAYDILTKCDNAPCIVDVFEQTAIWDDAECDGYCLFDEIRELLYEEGIEVNNDKG